MKRRSFLKMLACAPFAAKAAEEVNPAKLLCRPEDDHVARFARHDKAYKALMGEPMGRRTSASEFLYTWARNDDSIEAQQERMRLRSMGYEHILSHKDHA